jgi:queuine tRNA-ribosyltransferase
LHFELTHQDNQTKARTGRINTAHGTIETPAFMPDATRGAIQMVSSAQTQDAGIQEIVANTLHIYLRPGAEVVRQMGGLHKFMQWNRPILTDGGGFQIFSLIHRSKLKGKVTEEGMHFQSPLDGGMHLLTPEKSQEVQFDLGADIKMAFDDCIHAEVDAARNAESVRLTTLWSKRAKQRFTELAAEREQQSHTYAIVQGGVDKVQRKRSFDELVEIGFDGYAYGGWPVDGEGNFLEEIIGYTAELMPDDKAKYAMGVGTPLDMLRSVALGYDLFDCVLPTRNARHGYLYTSQGVLRIKAAEFKLDDNPIDPACSCTTCQTYSRAYLRHLFNVGEGLVQSLCTIHNLHYYAHWMQQIREAIANGRFSDFYQAQLAQTGERTSL